MWSNNNNIISNKNNSRVNACGLDVEDNSNTGVTVSRLAVENNNNNDQRQ